MTNWIWIAVGGGLGAVARWGVSAWMTRVAGEGWPWGTFLVNIVGATALGLLVVSLRDLSDPHPIRAFAAIGFLGSFTTFSTFSLEVVRLAEGGAWARAGGWAAFSVACGVAGVLLGIWIGTVARGAGSA